MRVETGMRSVHVDHHASEDKETCLQVCSVEVFDLKKTEVRNPLFWLKSKVQGGMQALWCMKTGALAA